MQSGGTQYCSCGYVKETMEHFLLERHLYYKQRKELRKKIRSGKMMIEKLLELSKFIKYTMEYIATIKGIQI